MVDPPLDVRDQNDKIVREWYLHLCDPTLPENVGGVLASAVAPY